MATTNDVTDVTIVCGNEEFPASKEKLSETSPYFAAMFNGCFREGSSNKVVLENVEPWEFRIIKQFTDSDKRFRRKLAAVSQLTFPDKLNFLITCNMMLMNELYRICLDDIAENAFKNNPIEEIYLLWDISKTLEELSLQEIALEGVTDYALRENVIPDLFSEIPVSKFLHYVVQIDRNAWNSRFSSSRSYRALVRPLNFVLCWVKQDITTRLPRLEQEVEKENLLRCVPAVRIASFLHNESEQSLKNMFETDLLDTHFHYYSDFSRWVKSKGRRIIWGLFCVDDAKVLGPPVVVFLEMAWRCKRYLLPADDFPADVSYISGRNCLFVSWECRLFLVYPEEEAIGVVEFCFIRGCWKSLSKYRRCNEGEERTWPVSCTIVNGEKMFIVISIGRKETFNAFGGEDLVLSNSTCQVLVYHLNSNEWDTAWTEPFEDGVPRLRGLLSLVNIDSAIYAVVHKMEEEEDPSDECIIETRHRVYIFNFNQTTKKLCKIFASDGDYRRREVLSLQQNSPGSQKYRFRITTLSNLIVLGLNCDTWATYDTESNEFTVHRYFLTLMCREATAVCGIDDTLWFVCSGGLFPYKIDKMNPEHFSRTYEEQMVTFSYEDTKFLEKFKHRWTMLSLGSFPV